MNSLFQRSRDNRQLLVMRTNPFIEQYPVCFSSIFKDLPRTERTRFFSGYVNFGVKKGAYDV